MMGLTRRRSTAYGLLASALLGFVAINGLAWMHVRAMTRFAPAGQRTAPPESLGWIDKAQILAFGVSLPRPTLTTTPADQGFDFGTHTVQVGAESLEIWTLPAPVAHAEVLLFHGYGGTKETLLPLVPTFHEAGLDVVLVDFRGSGGSDGDTTTLGVREADDVVAVVRWAESRTPGRARVLYGFSMGGAAVVRALGGQELPVQAAIIEATYDRLRTTVGHRFERMGLPSFPGTDLLLVWGSIELGASAFHVQPVEDAASIPIPVLVFGGSEDPRVHIDEAQSVSDAMVESRFVRLEGVGHELGIRAAPQRWTHEVRAFLSEELRATGD